MARNKTMDVMLALGIIYVVLGHSHQPSVFLLPAYTFQVAIFFFISGYFFQVREGFREKWLWTKKKFLHLLVPYFIFNFFFALLTLLLAGQGISLGENLSWYSFFVMPFVTGHQYFLFLAAWFVPQLFLVHVLAQWLIVRDRHYYLRFSLLALSLAGAAFLAFGFQDIPGAGTLVASRTVLALAFYLLGQAFKIWEPKLRSVLVSPVSFLLLYVLYVSLETFFGGFTYSLVFLQFLNGPLVTILGTLAAILLIYVISHYLAQSLPDKSFLLQIGRHTFSVMALHLLVFWLINCVLYFLSLVPGSALHNIFFLYRPAQFWFLYVILGVALPVLAALGYEKLKLKCRLLNKIS